MQGVISSALYFGLVAWALSKVGPLFVASYLPIQPVTSTLIAIFFSKSHLYLGRYVGIPQFWDEHYTFNFSIENNLQRNEWLH